MKRLVAAALGCIACGAVSAGAFQLTLDRRAIEEAIYIGQSRIERERTQFHAPYRVQVTQPPVDWIDVITPFHRVELAAEMNARSGGRIFGQREAMDALREAPNQIDLIIEMSFHPLNTFVAVPSYQVEIVLPGERRVTPRRIDRYPRFGPRAESAGPALPDAECQPCVRRGAACRRRNDDRGDRRIDAGSEPTGRGRRAGRKDRAGASRAGPGQDAIERIRGNGSAPVAVTLTREP